MSTHLERTLRHDGIVAVLDMTAGDSSWVGTERWKPIVLGAVRLQEVADEPSVRIRIGEHTLLIVGSEDHVVGVVIVQGHPIMKSVPRMIRQLMRPSSATPGAIV